MPILAAEPDLFPNDLLACPPDGGDWWALHTFSRMEKQLVRRLRQAEVPHYAPMHARRHRTPGGRLLTSHVPLFPGYVFLHGDDEHRLAALRTNMVLRAIRVPDGEQLREDLHCIQRLLQSGSDVNLVTAVRPGMRVRVTCGSLTGLEGIVLRQTGCDQLVVAVNFLQQGASITLDAFDVEPVTC